MDERPLDTTTEPVGPAGPAPLSAGRPPLWRRRPVQAAALVALVGITAGVWWGTRASTVHVRGTLQLGPLGSVDSTGTAANGDPCTAGEGYSDISAGAAVTVTGATGQVLGVGALSAGVERNVDTSAGMALGDCVFSFDVAVPSGQASYGVTISHRGTQVYAPDRVGSIALTLG